MNRRTLLNCGQGLILGGTLFGLLAVGTALVLFLSEKSSAKESIRLVAIFVPICVVMIVLGTILYKRSLNKLPEVKGILARKAERRYELPSRLDLYKLLLIFSIVAFLLLTEVYRVKVPEIMSRVPFNETSLTIGSVVILLLVASAVACYRWLRGVRPVPEPEEYHKLATEQLARGTSPRQLLENLFEKEFPDEIMRTIGSRILCREPYRKTILSLRSKGNGKLSSVVLQYRRAIDNLRWLQEVIRQAHSAGNPVAPSQAFHFPAVKVLTSPSTFFSSEQLMAGDLIYSCEGELITSVAELNASLATKTTKKKIPIGVLRYQEVTIKLAGVEGVMNDVYEDGWTACRALIKSGPLEFKVENNAD